MPTDDFFLEITQENPGYLSRVFDGRFPAVGEAVELVCVSVGQDRMAFRLRVRPTPQ
jgi:hypothetical protein